MKGTASEIKDSLKFISDESKVRVLSNFFKKHEGSYGHGDIFWGIKVPDNRAVAKGYIETPLSELEIMMDDEVHEVRLCAFLILVEKYSKSKKDPELSKGIVDFYLQNCHKANNWDMVDLSAPKILGEWLADPNKSSLSDREILFKLAKSSNLWEQRV